MERAGLLTFPGLQSPPSTLLTLPHPILGDHHFLFRLPPLVTSGRLSLWICLFWTFPVSGTRQWVALRVCLLLLMLEGSSMLQQASERIPFQC